MNYDKDITIMTGTIKNIKVYTNTKGTFLKGWFDKRITSTFPDGTPDKTKYVAGIEVNSTNTEVIATLMQLDKARVNTDYTPTLTIVGDLTTWFDNRPETQAKSGGKPVSRDQIVVDLVLVR